MPDQANRELQTKSMLSLTVRFLLILFVLVASMVLSVKFGSVDVTVSEIMHEIGIMMSTGNPGDSANSMILWQIRIPRTIFAALCGMGLSLCGMVLQTMTRNDLADPYVLGVSSGASTGAVIAIIWGWFMFFGNYNVSAGAFIGAAVSTFVVTMAAVTRRKRKRKWHRPNRKSSGLKPWTGKKKTLMTCWNTAAFSAKKTTLKSGWTVRRRNWPMCRAS